MTETEIAWLAGLLEGEGCFSYVCSPTIVLGMTDEDIVKRVGNAAGRHIRGPYQYAHNRKPVFYCNIHGVPAVEIMRAIRPYMGARRGAKIDEILAKYAIAPGKGHKLGTGLKPTCHPNSKHYADGMCRCCYRKDRYAKGLPR